MINNDHIQTEREIEMTNETQTELKPLDQNANQKQIVEALNKIITIVTTKRDRGPASTRQMTEADVVRFTSGDLKDVKTGEVAEKLGLSYGQVYSARNGFTFKKVVAKK